jgi:hypothetical protein
MMRKVPVPVTRASYSPLFFRFVLPIYFVVFGDLGFFVWFSNSFFNSCVSGCAIFIIDADPAMSSEALGGLPPAQATRQGSRASRGPRQRNEAEIKKRRNNNKETASLLIIPQEGEAQNHAGAYSTSGDNYSKGGGERFSSLEVLRAMPPLHSIAAGRGRCGGHH